MKKIICILLSVLLLVGLAGCCLPLGDEETSSTYNESLTYVEENYYDKNESTTTKATYPTYDEALEYIKDRFYDASTWTMLSENYFTGPDKAEILAIPGISITYKKGSVSNILYYDEDAFNKITIYRSDIDSAWDEVSYFYEDYSGIDLDLTAEELESNMQQKTSMPNWTSYEYEHNGFIYTVTVGNDYVSIGVE